jgi:glutaryl-CoA dehydrogenase
MLARTLFTDEHNRFRQTVRRFMEKEVVPYYAQWEKDGCVSREVWRKAGELGLLGINIPEEYGGSGADDFRFSTIVMEELMLANAPGVGFSLHADTAAPYLLKYCTEEQKQRWLPDMAAGKVIGCFGLTEPHGGSDPANMKTVAKKDGGDWVLNGAKMWITNGNIADIAIVWAQTDDGIQGFVVEKGMAGFAAQEIKHKMSLRASVTSALYLDGVRVPEANRLPDVKGLKGPLGCLTQARYGITWGPIGAAIACLDEALNYSKERILFDRPVAATQSAQMKLADMARRITLAQMLVLQLGRLKDAGAMKPAQVSLAKWNSCRMAIDIARECRDLLGGAGITTEHAAIRHALNLESVITYEGTETVHQLVIGRELTGISAF